MISKFKNFFVLDRCVRTYDRTENESPCVNRTEKKSKNRVRELFLFIQQLVSHEILIVNVNERRATSNQQKTTVNETTTEREASVVSSRKKKNAKHVHLVKQSRFINVMVGFKLLLGNVKKRRTTA